MCYIFCTIYVGINKEELEGRPRLIMFATGKSEAHVLSCGNPGDAMTRLVCMQIDREKSSRECRHVVPRVTCLSEHPHTQQSNSSRTPTYFTPVLNGPLHSANSSATYSFVITSARAGRLLNSTNNKDTCNKIAASIKVPRSEE